MIRTEDRLIEIARLQERLIARAEAQRAVIGESLRQLQGPINFVDGGLAMGRFLRAHPVLVAAVVAALVAFRRRGLFALAGRAVAVWRLWRSVSAWSAGRIG